MRTKGIHIIILPSTLIFTGNTTDYSYSRDKFCVRSHPSSWSLHIIIYKPYTEGYQYIVLQLYRNCIIVIVLEVYASVMHDLLNTLVFHHPVQVTGTTAWQL